MAEAGTVYSPQGKRLEAARKLKAEGISTELIAGSLNLPLETVTGLGPARN